MHQAGGSAAPWQGPAPSQRILRDFIQLRRRLTPYVESVGFGRTAETADSRAPYAAASLDDYARAANNLPPFEFGPAFWMQPAPPVATESLRVVLPDGPVWVDFGTGAAYAGGQVIRTSAPLELIPTFVRGGAIVPLATVDEQSGKITDPLEIRIYPGADGVFTLQEAGGAHGRVVFSWNDKAQELRIGARTGGVATRRRFEIVMVHPGSVAGHAKPARPNAVVDYEGAEVRLAMPAPAARPGPPNGLAATIQGGRVVLTWDAPSASPVYRLKCVLGAGGGHEDIASALLHPRHVIPLTACETTFDCVVTAMNSGGESAPSAPLRVVVPGGAGMSARATPTQFAKAV
jgi:hypothetical protein